MRTGPTILIISKNQWRPKDILKNHYKNLEKNNVIFYSYDDAIKHINKNWDYINKWWFNPRTRKSVSNFLNDLNCNEISLNKWNSYLNKMN